MAQSVEISRSRGGSTLMESVSTRLEVAPEQISWDAYRTDDARWIVTAHHGGRLLGTWSFESVGRTVHPQDESARALMGGGPSAVTSAPTESTTDGTDFEPDHPRPRLVSVTSDPLAADREDPTDRSDGEQEALVEQSDVSSTPRRAKRTKSKKGRASIPTWDEILFGASRPED
jgi:hypothetical protein